MRFDVMFDDTCSNSWCGLAVVTYRYGCLCVENEIQIDDSCVFMNNNIQNNEMSTVIRVCQFTSSDHVHFEENSRDLHP